MYLKTYIIKYKNLHHKTFEMKKSTKKSCPHKTFGKKTTKNSGPPKGFKKKVHFH